jgi:predicted AlkP superfamily phosphohydrolase/phosphomutase
MTKTVIVGLDGATWNIIEPLAGAGRLPNLAYMMREGATGSLQSTVPPVTPAAWTSVFTGKNPGKHGIYDFQELDPQTYEFRSIRTDRHHEKTLWELLTEADKRSIFMDVPFTYPPQPFNGLMLTGYGTPRTPGTIFTYPADLSQRLPDELAREVRVALPQHGFDRSVRFIEEWSEIMAGRRRLLNHLIRTESWDLFMVVFSITDNMAHVFWTYADPAHPNFYRSEAELYREAFLHAYELCDQLLGELMEAAGPRTTTLVLSDHGFGSIRPRQYLFRRLLEGGYTVGERRNGGNPLRQQLLKFAVNSYARFPFLREWAKNLRPGRRDLVKKSLQKAGALPGGSGLDYSQSKVIPSNFGLQLWINDAERFAQGPVVPAQKEQLLEELVEFLKADLDPIHKRPIVAEVHRGRDIYSGPFMERCPDLVIEYHDSYNPWSADVQRNPHVEGGHTHDGVLLAYGAGVQQTKLHGSRLIDIAPTVLHLLGQEIPPDMDGQVLEAMFSAAYRQVHPVRTGSKAARRDHTLHGGEYTAEQDAEVREQLRQLGYL